MHGEHGAKDVGAYVAAGSSPYARGAHEAGGKRTYYRGIIPVCTGSTAPPAGPPTYWWDHPRMHGEHGEKSLEIQKEQGSSPYARGALEMVKVSQGRKGIIPVCTGSTGAYS